MTSTPTFHLVFSITLMHLSLHPAQLQWPLNIDSSNQLLPCINCSRSAKTCSPLCIASLMAVTKSWYSQGRKKRFSLVYSFGRFILGSFRHALGQNILWYIVVNMMELIRECHGGQEAKGNTRRTTF